MRDGLEPGVGVEVVGAPHRLATGHPDRVRHGRELAEELHGRGAAADHEDPLAGEVLRSGVVDGVQLLAARRSRCPGSAARTAGVQVPVALTRVRVCHAALAGVHDQQVTLAGHAVDGDRAHDRQVEATLVVGEVRRHDDVGPARRTVPGADRVGQVRDAVHVVHAERVPAMLPGASGRSLASSTRWSMPRRARCRDAERPAWPAPMTSGSRGRAHRLNARAGSGMPGRCGVP